jgi:hypothetical protein
MTETKTHATAEGCPVCPALSADLRAKAGQAAIRARQYLADRQSPNGGFCFYRWQGIEESNLHDTWHAVAGVTLLGEKVLRRDDVEAFLSGFESKGIDDLYHRASTFERLDVAIDTDMRGWIDGLDAAAVFQDAALRLSARLEHALRIVRMQCLFSDVRMPRTIREYVLDLECEGGGWGDEPNIEDTWLALAILESCGERAFRQVTRAFVDALQVPSFGFVATRNSSYAQLDVVHAGLRACAALALPVRHAVDAVRFVLACQTPNGSFARAPDALPDIALTHRGLLALAAAGALQVPETPGWRADPGL